MNTITNEFPKEELIALALAEIAARRFIIKSGKYGADVVEFYRRKLALSKISLASLEAGPVVTFYRYGIEAAATWVDKQRDVYDSEHGRHDPDTGTFEFGNDAQRDYSATLEEIAEGIRALHPNAAPPAPVVPDDENGQPAGFAKWANRNFATNPVGTMTLSYCEDAWCAAMLQGSQPVSNRDELLTVCAEAYQVVGAMAEALGMFDSAEVQKVMDNLSQQKLVHADVLPFAVPGGNSPVTPDYVCPCCGRKPLKHSKCSVPGCGRKHVARGLCQRHYDMKRREDPEQVEKFREANRRFTARKRANKAAPQQEDE